MFKYSKEKEISFDKGAGKRAKQLKALVPSTHMKVYNHL